MRERRAVKPSGHDGAIEARETQEAQRSVARHVPRQNIRSTSLLILALLAVIAALYLGKEVILPVVLAIILKMLLQPGLRLLVATLRLPGPLASALLIAVLFGAIGGIAFTVSIPASGWIQKAPETLPVLKEKLALLRQPIDYIQSALKEVENATSGGGEAGGQTITVRQGSGLLGQVFSGTATTLSRFLETVVVLFFLLASGDRLLRGFVEILPRFEDKRRAVEIATEIETNISGYLLTITVMNTLVGIATGTAMWACGLGDPILWGTTAFFLNYIPILGPMTGVAIFFAAGLLTLPWPWWALVPAGLYLTIHIIEGEMVTPMLLARRFTLNPVLVIISLFFWHALWGIPGALLAVPILAIFKIVADRVDPLKPIGHLIGS